MECKTLRLEIKELGEAGTFTGYVAVTGNRDLGRDIITPGAFAKTLNDKGGRVPLLDGHDPNKRIGLLNVSEDAKGLKVDKGVLNLKTVAGQEAYADMQFYHDNAMPLGLSIGYDVVKKEYQTDKGGETTRLLKELALWEGSLVTFPMNPKARVANVKGIGVRLASLVEEAKAGRVLSAANMTKLSAAMTALGDACEEIEALLEAAGWVDPDDAEAAGKHAAAPGNHAEVKPPTIVVDWLEAVKATLNT